MSHGWQALEAAAEPGDNAGADNAGGDHGAAGAGGDIPNSQGSDEATLVLGGGADVARASDVEDGEGSSPGAESSSEKESGEEEEGTGDEAVDDGVPNLAADSRSNTAHGFHVGPLPPTPPSPGDDTKADERATDRAADGATSCPADVATITPLPKRRLEGATESSKKFAKVKIDKKSSGLSKRAATKPDVSCFKIKVGFLKRLLSGWVWVWRVRMCGK